MVKRRHLGQLRVPAPGARGALRGLAGLVDGSAHDGARLREHLEALLPGKLPQTWPVEAGLRQRLITIGAGPLSLRVLAYAMLSTAPQELGARLDAAGRAARLAAPTLLRLGDAAQLRAIDAYLVAYEGVRARARGRALFDPSGRVHPPSAQLWGELRGAMDTLTACGVPPYAPIVTWSSMDGEDGAEDASDTIRSGPVSALVARSFDDVAPAILPSNWARCLPGFQVEVLTGDPDRSRGSIQEIVSIGPWEVQVACKLDIWVSTNTPDRLVVQYALQDGGSSELSVDEGWLSVERLPRTELAPTASSVVTIAKSICFQFSLPVELGRNALRDLLLTWLNQGVNQCQA